MHGAMRATEYADPTAMHSPRTARMRKVVIDTDGGIDDAVAIWWAVTNTDLDVVGISTVWGNVALDVATANVFRVLEAAGRTDIPVALGVERAIARAPIMRPADFVHGTDGLGNTNRPTAAVCTTMTLAELWQGPAVSAEVLVTLGPLSTVATALELSVIPTSGIQLVTMGGTVAAPGNALPAAEANIAHDPTAAAAVLSARWSQPPLLVGLDVTHRATFTAPEIALVEAQGNAPARWLAEPLRFYRNGGSAFVPEGESPCHDLLAIMAAALPDLVSGPVLPVAVQCEPGPAWGMTVADRRGLVRAVAPTGIADQPTPPGFSDVRVALDVDVERFRRGLVAMFSATR